LGLYANTDGLTFGKFAEQFLEDHTGKRRSNHYPSNVRELVKVFGDRPLASITRDDLDRYAVALATTPRQGRKLGKRAAKAQERTHAELPPLTPTTVLKRLRVVHRMFRMAVRWGLLTVNPAADLDKPAPNKGKTVFLTRDQFDTLEGAVPPWVRPMIRLSVGTGMRLKETTGLRWEDVDLTAGVLWVAQDTKTGARPIPVSSAARAVLTEQQARRKTVARKTGTVPVLVFAADDGSTWTDDESRRRVSEAVRKAAVRVGLGRGIGFHTFRHTAASWMVQAGTPLYVVQRILGHSTPMLTARYGHLQPDHLRSGIDAVDAVLDTPTAQSKVAQPHTHRTNEQSDEQSSRAVAG
jgi:integrase